MSDCLMALQKLLKANVFIYHGTHNTHNNDLKILMNTRVITVHHHCSVQDSSCTQTLNTLKHVTSKGCTSGASLDSSDMVQWTLMVQNMSCLAARRK